MVEVIGAGWGRTGTLSLKTALDTLGFPTYHMMTVFERPADAHEWRKLATGEAPVDVHALLHGFKACVDWPGASCYRQLMAAYPDAKVILSVRSPDKWVASIQATIWRATQTMRSAPWYARVIMEALATTRGAPFRRMVEATVWADVQNCDFDAEPERAAQLFTDHVEAVTKAVPADKLLVFQPSDGWGPLCAFLGVPVPAGPYPHVNDTKQFQAMVAGMRRATQLLTYGVPALAAAVLAGGVALLLRRRQP